MMQKLKIANKRRNQIFELHANVNNKAWISEIKMEIKYWNLISEFCVAIANFGDRNDEVERQASGYWN